MAHPDRPNLDASNSQDYIFGIDLNGVDWVANPNHTSSNPHVQAMRTELADIAKVKLGTHRVGSPEAKRAYREFTQEWAKRVYGLRDERKLNWGQIQLTFGIEGTETDWVDAGVILLPNLALTDQIVATPEGAINAGFFFGYLSESQFRAGPNNPNWLDDCNRARLECFGVGITPTVTSPPG